MDPITLIVGGGALLLLLARKRGVSPGDALVPGGPLPGSADDPRATQKSGQTEDAIAGGATALAGGTLGMTAGAMVAAGAGAALAGKELGKTVDELLGGTGTGTTGVIAQGTLALSAGIAAAAGVATLSGALLAAGVPVIGLIIAAGILQLGASVYIIASAWSDLERLRYGQGGARQDFETKWSQTQQACRDALGRDGRVKEALASFSPEKFNDILNLISWAYTDGYMNERNYRAYVQWMKRPHGIGMDDAAHARFGWERGYFIGELQGAQLIDPPMHTASADFQEWAKQFVECVQWTCTKEQAVYGEVATVRMTQVRRTYQQCTAEVSRLASNKGEAMESCREVEVVENVPVTDFLRGIIGYETVQYPCLHCDVNKELAPFKEQGRIHAQLAIYVEWMKTEHGHGVDDIGHAAVGEAKGYFSDRPRDGAAIVMPIAGAIQGTQRIYYKDLP